MEASRVLKKGLFNQRISLKKGFVHFCAKFFSKGVCSIWKIFLQKGLFNFWKIFSQKGFVQFLENIFPFSTTLFKNFSCLLCANGLITSLLSALTLLITDFSP